MELTSTVVATRVGSRAETGSRVHLAYLDNLRILLTGLVVLHHFAIICGAGGGFYGLEVSGAGSLSSALLTLFTAVNQSFFMGMFFLISAYLPPRSYDRKGAVLFLTDRLKRLGIPLLFFACVINPLLSFVVALSRGFQGTFWQYLTQHTDTAISVGPLWFVETLLLFALGYALFRAATRSTSISPERAIPLRAPGNRSIALFAVALGILTFIVRLAFPVGWWLEPLHLQVADFPQYIPLLVVGIVAFRNNWFERWSEAQTRAWRWVVLAMLPTCVVAYVAGGALTGNLDPFYGGPTWQALALSLWEQIMGVAMIMWLLGWFRGRFNRQSTLARSMSDATYAVYVFHAAVLVPLALALRSVSLDGGLKFLVVAPVALTLAFALGMGIKRLPFAREVF